MSSSAEFSVREVIVAPGGEEFVSLTVRNISPSPEVFSLVTTGLAQAWMHIEPATVALPPGSFETVTVALRPPRSWAVGAGPTPFGVRVVPQSGSDEITIADGLVTVLSFDERRLHIAQPVVRSRRRAEFDLVLENTGNTQASCRLTLIDATRRVKGTFRPPSVGVDPGASQPTQLVVHARRRRWRNGRSLPFFVQASQDGHPPIEISGTLLQDPTISGRTIGRLCLAGLAAATLVGGWFGVVRPAIDDAAERAVAEFGLPDEAQPSVDPATSLGGEIAVDGIAPSATSISPGPASAATGKTAFDRRLEATAAIGEQGTAAFTVPAGQRLRVSDVLLQNPNRDAGRLSILRNGDALYEAALDNITDYAIPLFSPTGLVFEAGETVTLQITCQGIGDPTGQACVIGTTLVGTLENA